MWAVTNYFEDLSFWVPKSDKSKRQVSRYEGRPAFRSKLDKLYILSDYIIRESAKAVEKTTLPKYLKKFSGIVEEKYIEDVAKTLEIFGVDLFSAIEGKGIKIMRGE